MTVQTILKMGDPRLLRVAESVREFDTPQLHALLVDLFDSMHAAGGVGLAAPQIGVNLRVVIFGFKKSERYPDAPPVPETILINPELTPIAEEKEDGWEGCLSVPGMRGMVPRYTKLRYRGFDQFGREIDRTVDGFHARVVQHECDHLDGVLYPMRITDFTKFGFTEVLFPDMDPAEDD